jgi:hypothetical protein
VKDGTAVTLSGIPAPPDGWGVTSVDIYRSASGIRRGVDEMQNAATVWLHVGRVAAGTTTFTDSVLMKNLGPAMDTEDVRVPPAGLRQIRHIEGTGTLCGKDGCRLHFCENFQPWNWPVEHDMTFPHGIVNLASVGTAVFLSTSARTYVVDGSPSCSDSLQSRRVLETDVLLPDLGAGRPHSAAATPFGMVFPSPTGLALVNAKAEVKILTGPWYTPAQWSRLRPDTARLAFWRGMIFCVTDVVSLVLHVDPQPYGDPAGGTLTTISDRPDDLWTTESGELLMLEGGKLRQWDAGTGVREFVWQSAEVPCGGGFVPTWIKIRTEGTWFSIAPGAGRAERRWSEEIFISGPRPRRLRRTGRHDRYSVRVRGTCPVEYVSWDVTALAGREEPPWQRTSL